MKTNFINFSDNYPNIKKSILEISILKFNIYCLISLKDAILTLITKNKIYF